MGARWRRTFEYTKDCTFQHVARSVRCGGHSWGKCNLQLGGGDWKLHIHLFECMPQCAAVCSGVCMCVCSLAFVCLKIKLDVFPNDFGPNS